MRIAIHVACAGLALFANGGFASTALKTEEELNAENKQIEDDCKDSKNTKCTKEKLDQKKENDRALEDLKDNFKFGVALGYEHYRRDYVNSASTVGTTRIVNVSDSEAYKASIWLETHYMFFDTAQHFLHWNYTAPGFYVGARALGPNSDLFDAFSVGLLMGFKRTKIGTVPPKDQVADSINLGFGPVWHRTQVLADGIEEGKPLPAQYNDVTLDKRDEVSWMVMVSAGF
jgi:hypothetical protein